MQDSGQPPFGKPLNRHISEGFGQST